MRAMILAAGRGARLRPLTDTCPKPLVPIAGKPLIVYHLENLKKAGITDIVINVCYLGEQIQQYCGNGKLWGVNITYSVEAVELEVGGGICNALPLLGPEPFALVNGDVWSNYSFTCLPTQPEGTAHLILVNNPVHHSQGDFAIDADGLLSRQTEGAYTYSGIAVLRPELFSSYVSGTVFRLAPLFDKAIKAGSLTGEHFSGEWTDVGTLERLQNLEKSLAYTSLPAHTAL
jgi:MurNAc alpha-1-phosphate uridylyltransferase